jgi:prepilin-type N-terminal cleavage/methylation domain-containing protein
MNRLFRTKRKGAFTLIELLVVIAIIALLAAILAPAVTRALQKGRITALVANGSSLYKLFFSRMMDNPLGLQSSSGQAAWPSTDDETPFTDSTSYFATLVTNKNFSLSYNFFAAPGITPANSEEEFLDERLRNAWAMTMDVNDQTTMTTPVLFTQNIRLTGREITQFEKLDETAVPFGNAAAVIVYMGGSSFAMEADTALGTNFNPVGTSGQAIYPKNGIL